MLDRAAHKRLDGRLRKLLTLLDAQAAAQQVTSLSRQILDENAQAPGVRHTRWLLYAGWEETWRRDQDVRWGQFCDPAGGHDEPAWGALLKVFVALVRLVLDGGSAYRLRKHIADLRGPLADYLDRRGFDVSEPSVKPLVLAALRIVQEGNGNGMLGKQIVLKLAKQGFKITTRTFYRHVGPVLKSQCGVRNDRTRGGYYWPGAGPGAI